MLTSEEIVPTPPQTIQQQTEAEYDSTVRTDIELFRSYAEKFVAGEITDDQFRAQRLRRGICRPFDPRRQQGERRSCPGTIRMPA